VADKRYALLLRFICNTEVGVARQQRIDFHKICARLLNSSDGLATFVFVAYCDRVGPDGLRSIDDRTGDNHAWAEQRALGNLIAPSQQIRVAEHLSYTGHAVSDEKS